MNTWVVQQPDGGPITDLLSFYTLPSTVIGNETYNELKVGPVHLGTLKEQCALHTSCLILLHDTTMCLPACPVI